VRGRHLESRLDVRYAGVIDKNVGAAERRLDALAQPRDVGGHVDRAGNRDEAPAERRDLSL